jgi:hypothetical protein
VEETDQLHILEEASLIGDLDKVHNIYSTLFAKQRPDPITGSVCKDLFYFAAYRAATNDQPACLA